MRLSELSFKYLSFFISSLVMACFTGSYLTIKYFTTFEESRNQVQMIQSNEVKRVQVAIEYSKAEVKRVIEDYAAWSGMAQFIASPNQRFLEEDLNDHTFEALKMDGIFIFDTNHKMVWGQRYDLQSEQRVSMEPFLDILPKLMATTKAFPSDKILTVEKVITIDNEPYIYSKSKVCNSLGKDCSKGYILFVRKLTDTFFRDIEIITGLTLSIHMANIDSYLPDREGVSYVEYSDKINGNIFIIEVKHSVLSPDFVSMNEIVALCLFGLILVYINYFVVSLFTKPIDRANALFFKFEEGRRLPEESTFSTKEMKIFVRNINQVIGEIEKKRSIYQKESNQDPLTKLANRRKFENFLLQRLNDDTSKYISVLLMDIDHFKLINDNYGHTHGDHVLKKVSAELKRIQFPGSALVSRYGGEEFCIVLVTREKINIADEAERLVKGIEALAIENNYSPISDKVTVSVGGVDMLNPTELDYRRLINYADKSLYLAKRDGRNGYKVESISSNN